MSKLSWPPGTAHRGFCSGQCWSPAGVRNPAGTGVACYIGGGGSPFGKWDTLCDTAGRFC